MAITISGNDIYIKKGDSASINLDFNINITGATLYFTVKASIDNTENTFQKVVTSHSDAANGLTTITLSSTDTNITAGQYVYDIQINLQGGAVHTIFPSNANKTGYLYITKGVS
ncbi:MAG TPA: hypothetical protein P5556_03040 [Candidatus Gastranaerophilales bacterium]|nr:hypothetical protein [Candidatus Gastranaerophilales bacterium]